MSLFKLGVLQRKLILKEYGPFSILIIMRFHFSLIKGADLQNYAYPLEISSKFWNVFISIVSNKFLWSITIFFSSIIFCFYFFNLDQIIKDFFQNFNFLYEIESLFNFNRNAQSFLEMT